MGNNLKNAYYDINISLQPYLRFMIMIQKRLKSDEN